MGLWQEHDGFDLILVAFAHSTTVRIEHISGSLRRSGRRSRVESQCTADPSNHGVEMPQIGLGTWPMDDGRVETAIASAFARGYRLFDTAVK